ncbi:MAG: bifunctional YncE family protein/alkaline phosphatase family protein [Pirellulaceae bacterium]
MKRSGLTQAVVLMVVAISINSLAIAQSISNDQDLVGRTRDDAMVTPVNQILTPAGMQIELSRLRPQVLALSPNGKILLASGKTSELLVIDPESYEIRQHVDLPAEDTVAPSPDPASDNILHPDTKGQVSYTGLIFAPDGKRVFLSNVNGSIKVFDVVDGNVSPSHTIPLPAADAPRRKAEIPAGLAISSDGLKLYVCGNLSNQLLVVDLKSNEVSERYPVGSLPYDVVIADGMAFVSNWAGPAELADQATGPAGRGTEVRVDSQRHIASEGSVSVVDLQTGELKKEIAVGLHASDLALSPDGKFIICANAGSDNLSVISVRDSEVVDTIWAKGSPAELLGATPNAIVFDESGEHLFVANGSQNAVAVVELDLDDRGESRVKGLIPVGWFPGAIVYHPERKRLFVANIKGLSDAPRKQGDGTQGYNTHHYHGTISCVPVPDEDALEKFSSQVELNLRRGSIEQALLPPRENEPPRVIPERIGEPSKIKHVVYIIKENRTYDQVFGAFDKGNGDASLCVFGEDITPNQHKMVREFHLLDNTYCAGILSADGHNWSTTAMSTDYMEKSFAGFPRSYPDGMGIDENDAMAYSPAGFIWDNALAHNVSIRNYGEFMMPNVRWRDPERRGSPDFTACYQAWNGENDDVIFESEPSIETIRPFSPTGYVGWNMSVPDQYRADFFIDELKDFEEQGTFPQLTIICLPNDHTSGASRGCPTTAACMADSDLAFGRIVEALSHSRFWNEMAIFCIEDDPQAGWDHVSGYRTTAFCLSPYAKRNGVVVSTLYNTTSVLRTMEQILGLPPMNQFDASATPMFDCFTAAPDFTAFDSLPNSVPINQMNPEPASIQDPQLREDAIVSGTLNFRVIDAAPEDTLNRIIWRSRKGTSIPYPEWAITVIEDDDD